MKPLVVKPAEAFAALGVGVTKGYELMNTDQLEVVKIGRATRITVASIEAFVKRGGTRFDSKPT